MKKQVSIVGFGRFGRTLYYLLKDDFSVTIFDQGKNCRGIKLSRGTHIAKNLADVYVSDTIFFVVPISAFETVIREHKKYFREHLLIDVLSVKLHPAVIFQKELKGTKARALLTHPLFGLDSKKGGFGGLSIVLDRFLSTPKEYIFWKTYFKKKGLVVIEMSAREHDKYAAKSQGVTHFIGRMLHEIGFKPTPIDTLGAQKLYEVQEQTCNDTWELFVNLQNYNPYTKEIRLTIGKAYDTLYNRLLPEYARPGSVVFGIQGMAHPQALKQCQGTLLKRFPNLKLESGAGDLIDTARAAKALMDGDIAKNVAILGPAGLSKIYNLDVIAENMQDEKENQTSFLLVKRG